MHNNLAIFTTESSTKDFQIEKPTNKLKSSENVKVGKTVYTIERHFSGERDIRNAIFMAVQNEAFRAG